MTGHDDLLARVDASIEALGHSFTGRMLQDLAAALRAVTAERDELQRRLDARAVDLGRFTQSTVDGTKALEQEIHALRSVIRRLLGDWAITDNWFLTNEDTDPGSEIVWHHPESGSTEPVTPAEADAIAHVRETDR